MCSSVHGCSKNSDYDKYQTGKNEHPYFLREHMNT